VTWALQAGVVALVWAGVALLVVLTAYVGTEIYNWVRLR